MEALLVKKIIYTGKIQLKTGLHIGGTNASLNIGGPDKFVVRNPLTNIPYIPGSSLKGKMRSLIELMEGSCNVRTVRNGIEAGPSEDPETKAGKLFGIASRDIKRPSRLVVRDANMDISNEKQFENTDLPFTESKTEVSIDRISSAANPRTFERVPAGAEFFFEMVLNVFADDNEAELKSTLNQALKLLQDDYLGGHGSRGYGQIEFVGMKEEERNNEYYKEV